MGLRQARPSRDERRSFCWTLPRAIGERRKGAVGWEGGHYKRGTFAEEIIVLCQEKASHLLLLACRRITNQSKASAGSTEQQRGGLGGVRTLLGILGSSRGGGLLSGREVIVVLLERRTRRDLDSNVSSESSRFILSPYAKQDSPHRRSLRRQRTRHPRPPRRTCKQRRRVSVKLRMSGQA